jgi:hypothetical protein
VEVTYSTFNDYGLGVFATAHVETNVRHSTFTNFSAGSVTYSGFNPGTPAGSNRYSFGTMEYNHISGCGSSGCVRAVEMTGGAIQHNQIDGTGTSAKQFGIFLQVPTDATGHAPIQINDNQITSTFLGGDPNLSSSYSVTNGISMSDQPGVVTTANDNTITNAFIGIAIANDFNGSDNLVQGGTFALNVVATRSIAFHRNDLTGQVRSFQIVPSATVAAGSLTCNYWGTATGPFNYLPATAPTNIFTPFSVVPIANQPGVICP